MFNLRGAVIGVAAAATLVDLVAARLLDRTDLSGAVRLMIALLPLPGDLLLVAIVVARIRRLDEFQQRIHFEAVVVAFLSTGVAVFVYGYLRKAAAVGPLNAAIVWAFMLVSYSIGYVVAAKHYR